MSGFGEASYDLGACILRKLTQQEAEYLATEFTKIEPWKTLRSTVNGLTQGFMYQDTSTNTYAVVVDGVAIGVISVRYPWLAGPYLGFLGLIPSSQGKGLGKILMDWLEDCTKIHAASNIFICVSAFNHEAQAFYKSCGFSKVADLDGLIVDQHAELLLRKRLSL